MLIPFLKIVIDESVRKNPSSTGSVSKLSSTISRILIPGYSELHTTCKESIDGFLVV
jgi:hypothetical protein